VLTLGSGYGRSFGAAKPYDCSDWTASMECARAWLGQCMVYHSDCPITPWSKRTIIGTSHALVKPTPYRPTRLLEIGEPEATKVRLRLSSELDSTLSQYATLSHCWGKSKTLRLTSESFQRFRDGVAVTDLAKTFQDAMLVAQSIGIKLLWIDTFCIFQDSTKDWQQEAGSMSQVYRNSFLNIAASIAVDSDVGFLHERASTVEPCTVQTAWTDFPNGNYCIYDWHYWNSNFRRMPLKRRAWVFQENILAPRVLHFCGTQMFWECHGLLACETWPTGLPIHMSTNSLKGRQSANYDIFGSKSTYYNGPSGISVAEYLAFNKSRIGGAWMQLVKEYNACNLTFPSDKLIALSGVAKYMERLLDIEYCAGLWSFDLISGLAWSRERNLEPAFPEIQEPIPYRAPSWSWACLDGPIKSHGYQREDRRLVDVVSCDVETATKDRTGAVTSAVMKLSGYLATIKLHRDFGTKQPYPATEGNFEIYCDGKWNSMGAWDFNFDLRPPTFQLHCLFLFIDEFRIIYGLLLTPTKVTRGHFRRVGMLQDFLKDNTSLDLNQFSHFKNESWLEYESVDDDGKYTITII